LALITSGGTRSAILPLADLPPLVACVLLCWTLMSYPRNLARWVRAWVIRVFSGLSSSLRVSRRNLARSSLISRASAFVPVNPSRWSSAYLIYLSRR
jgi:hypothetical protein